MHKHIYSKDFRLITDDVYFEIRFSPVAEKRIKVVIFSSIFTFENLVALAKAITKN